MKIYYLIFFLIYKFSFAQITTTKVFEEDEVAEKYDSLQNFLGKDVYKYIGQELYVKPKSKDLRKYGYDGFILNIVSKPFDYSNVYKCCESFNSKYSELVGKYFKVKAVHKHPDPDNTYDYKKFYLELNEKETGERIYYEYDYDFEFQFPFIVVGFYEKLKKIFVNNKYILPQKTYNSLIDVNSGKQSPFAENKVWNSIDLTIEEKYSKLAVKMTDQSGIVATLDYEILLMNSDGRSYYTISEAKKYEKKFGNKNWSAILNNKVAVGFTEEMAILSWGEPERINTTSYSSDQWVYPDNYLYFKNNKLVAFN